jgi:hypothetical protein
LDPQYKRTGRKAKVFSKKGLSLLRQVKLRFTKHFGETLRETNVHRFLHALEQASLPATVANTPQINAFAPLDFAFSRITCAGLTPALLRRHLWKGALGIHRTWLWARRRRPWKGLRSR